VVIQEIFVDQDGVICDFHKKYKELFNSDAIEDYNDERPDVREIHQKRFASIVEGKLFETLDPMPDFELGLEFLVSIRKKYNIPISILTSTAREEYLKELSEQKKFWLKKHGVPFYPVFVPGKRFKHYYSKSGRILIDDVKSTIENWNSMGGIGIHHKSWKETIEIVLSLL
jgi:hypothetical protein